MVYDYPGEDNMYECPECGEKVDEEDVEFDCPFCGETDMGEGFYTCENCETLFDYEGDFWECEFCHNEGMVEKTEEIDSPGIIDVEICPECGEILEDDDYCYSCGWPNNQGWIGENYG